MVSIGTMMTELSEGFLKQIDEKFDALNKKIEFIGKNIECLARGLGVSQEIEVPEVPATIDITNDTVEDKENVLHNNNILFIFGSNLTKANAHYFKLNDFCGKFVDVQNIKDMEILKDESNKNAFIYIVGKVDDYHYSAHRRFFLPYKGRVYSFSDFCYYDFSSDKWAKDIELKQIKMHKFPRSVHGVGLFFDNFFDYEKHDYYKLINEEHKFQVLTESNKPDTAYRNGIYLTEVKETGMLRSEFKLLRCSTNFQGPTENFGKTDVKIIRAVNEVASMFYKYKTDLNHVLAQNYINRVKDDKQKKARIKEHSDKTKDMPKNGLIAFCTFYDFSEELKRQCVMSGYDYTYKNNSIFMRLRFRLKEDNTLKDAVEEFEVTLYPGSLFIISLETNRNYTHEVIPSLLNVDKIPTRLGYVIRCSKTDAFHYPHSNDDGGSVDGTTYIKNSNGTHTALVKPTPEDVAALKQLYADENLTSKEIEYKDVNFSLNDGDYMIPNYITTATKASISNSLQNDE